MPKPPLDTHKRRDQQVIAMVTSREKAAVKRVARELGMSMSTAARFLILKGLMAHDPDITFSEEGD